MKKCPRCMKTEENDLTRFCKHCGTELFFLDRFPKNDSTGVKNNKKVNMKFAKIIVDIFMLVFIVLSLLRWDGDPTFHIAAGSIFAILFIMHFVFNFRPFIKMTEKFGKLKIQIKLQYIVDVLLILVWTIVLVAGIIAAFNYLSTGSLSHGLGRFHGVLGRIGCGFIGIHIIQHIKHICSYFKVKKRKISKAEEISTI